jgi:hypothetical protein
MTTKTSYWREDIRTEVIGIRRRRNQLLDDLKEETGYLELKEDTFDRTLWRKRSGRGYGPVVIQAEE